MAGSSKGMAKTFLIGARVSTRLDNNPTKCVFMDYTPANLRGGDRKKVNARLMIPVMINLLRKDEGDGYRIIAWGKLADTFARHLNRGKEMHFECEPTKYLTDIRSRVDGAIIMDKDGQPLRIRRTSYRIVDFSYGNDSYNTLQEEINMGIVTGEGNRPANWNVPNHPDYGIWKQLLENRNNTYFSQMHQDKGFFGFARVVMPRTQGYQVLHGPQYEPEAVFYDAQGNVTAGPQQQVNQPIMPPQQQFVGPQTQTAPLVNQVNQTLNPGYVAQNNVAPQNQSPHNYQQPPVNQQNMNPGAMQTNNPPF